MIAVDWEQPELASAKAAIDSGDTTRALSALLTYYKSGHGWQDAYRQADIPTNLEEAPRLLEDVYTLQGATGKVVRNSDGSLDWYCRGPNNDRQFARFLNRCFSWNTLMGAFLKTGNVAYTNYLDQAIRDWIVHNPLPAAPVNNDHPWWVLDAGLRAGQVWPRLFYRLIASEQCHDATAILMLSSIADHGVYLRRHHWIHHNHASMEIYGLANIALSFPEFSDSSEWLDHALKIMQGEMEYQFYPDGAQKELTSHYHRVSLTQFDDLSELCKLAGHSPDNEINRGREKAWNYLARSMRPSGYAVLNNDSDLDDNRKNVIERSKEFKRQDWRYIATQRAEGEPLKGPPSAVFPWAGQLISRSGWDVDAHWSFFDAGPWGISHQHNDKLHLSISAFGRDILVDSGRFRYIDDEWRKSYYLHSRSHNVILIDGQQQADDEPEAFEPWTEHEIHSEFDFAIQRTSPKLFAGAVHTRAVVYLRAKYWIVFDRIQSTEQHRINPLWHFHPDCTVKADGVEILTIDPEKGNLRIKPITTINWKLDLVQGQTSPEIQGWYSRKYNSNTPSTCAVYTGNVEGDQVFAWLIIPARGEPETPEIQLHPSGPGIVDLSINNALPVRVIANLGDPDIPVALPDGTQLHGHCAIYGLGNQPLLALGHIDPTE